MGVGRLGLWSLGRWKGVVKVPGQVGGSCRVLGCWFCRFVRFVAGSGVELVGRSIEVSHDSGIVERNQRTAAAAAVAAGGVGFE